MAFSMPKTMGNGPKAVASTFAQSSNDNAMHHGRPQRGGRQGVKTLVKNPFQGAIDKQPLAARKY